MYTLVSKENLRKNKAREIHMCATEVVARLGTTLGSSIRSKYLLENILSKYADPSPASAKQRERDALAKFLWQSRVNKRFNKNFRLHNPEILPGVTRDSLLYKASRHASRIIGEFQFEKCVSRHANFSNGASTAFKRVPGVATTKFEHGSHVTPNLYPYLPYFIYQNMLPFALRNRGVRKPSVFRGNIMFTVPKNDEIDRAACKEPDLNMFLQKGLGTYVRKKLKINGIDLNDQSINQRLAKEGSITGNLCTVDLSAASDSITSSLIDALFPWEWALALKVLRSEETRVNGVWRKLDIFSTMGNGFTFEVESLIFYVLVLALRDTIGSPNDTISIYGDDIVAPTHYFAAIKALFEACNFRVNEDKSFFSGTFRESCGKWYDSGIDVTPFFIRKPIDSIQRVIWLLNKVKEWDSWISTDSHGRSVALLPELSDFVKWIYEKYPILRRLLFPGDYSSENVIVSPFVKGKLHEDSRNVKISNFGAYLAALHSGGERSVVRKGNGRLSIRKYSGTVRRHIPFYAAEL